MTENIINQTKHTFQNNRFSGILVHPTSFPSKYGIGDLGHGSYAFIDYLVSAGQTLWQVLPLGPTGYGDSPYQSFSAFAGQPLLISPEELLSSELLTAEALMDYPVLSNDFTDYGSVISAKNILFKKAYKHFNNLLDIHPIKKEYKDFCEANAYWLEDYALFMELKEQHGQKSWLEWEDETMNPSSSLKKELREKYSTGLDFHKMVQFIFFKQWFSLKKYANENGIRIIGDIPIFVSLDSADVWANQSLFLLDSKGFPTAVAGVPPDYFSVTGQLWGNPLYDWEAQELDGYHWWISRIESQLKLVDFIRIDHFRGFVSYWAVPFGEKTAISGTWQDGPKEKLFQAIQQALGDDVPIWAEDLGVITKEVQQLREQFQFPGMKILQFAFEKLEDNDMMPEHHTPDSICYTGTHDNDTCLGWYQHTSNEKQQKARQYMHTGAAIISWAFIQTASASASSYVIIPLQDIMSLDSSARMNTPGIASGNWGWRYKESDLDSQWAFYLKNLTIKNHRLIVD